MFYQGAHVVIFLFDVTDIMSFIFVKKLIGKQRATSPFLPVCARVP
jgi:hypothetical protein